MPSSTLATLRRTRSRRRVRPVVAAVAVLATALPILAFGSGPSAAAEARTVTVTPSTGIDPAGATVSARGVGFDSSGARGIYAQFCKKAAGEPGTAAGRPAPADCSSAQAWITADPTPGTTKWTGDGTFDISLAIEPTFKDVDCRAAGTECGIVTRNDHTERGQFDQDTFTPVTFKADPVARTVTVTPSTGIDPSGTTVNVQGAGFDSSGERGVYAQFCKKAAGEPGTAAGRPAPADCSSAQAWITADPTPGTTKWTGDGTFDVSLTLVASFKDVDCRAAGTECGIVTRNDHTERGQFDQDTFTPVTFKADPVDTGLTVTPTTGLDAAGDTVTVTGSGYAPGVGVYVRLCQATTGTPGTAAGRIGPEVCDGQGLWVNETTPGPGTAPMKNGAFEIQLPVTGAFAGTSKVIDCMAAGSCGIVVRRDHMAPTDYSLDQFVPLTFDPATTPPVVTPPEEPSINTVELTVPKTTDVLDGESLVARGAKYQAEQGIYVQYCAKPTGQLGTAAGRATVCFPGQDGTHTVWVTPIPADGTFRSAVVVEKSFELEDGTVVDCTAPGSCGVYTRRDHNGGGSDYSQDAFVPITFGDGEAPPATEAALTADRTTDLDPTGDEIVVDGTGFRPGVDYVVALCDVADPAGCDYAQAQEVTAAEAAEPTARAAVQAAAATAPGSFQVTLPVAGAFDDTNCTTTSSCAVVTWAVSLSEEGDEVELPVSFAGSVPDAGAPTPDPTPSPTPSGPGSSSGVTASSLPKTGADARQPLFVGLAAVGIGAALTVAGRRRRAELA